MSRIFLFYILFMNFLTINGTYGTCPAVNAFDNADLSLQDSIPDNQTLFNGRVWRNLYTSVKEDQFLFSREFLPGSVTMRGKTFSNIKIRFDIFKDEILIPGNPGGILQLNKEMVDSFSILFKNKRYQFTRIPVDSLTGLEGYCNVLYNGKHALYVKYSKKIEKLADEGKYDKFYQISRIYLLKDNIFHPVSSKNDLIKLLSEDRAAIRNFINKNKITVSKESPESFIPVIGYLDTLR
jgi:hypothetical protein